MGLGRSVTGLVLCCLAAPAPAGASATGIDAEILVRHAGSATASERLAARAQADVAFVRTTPVRGVDLVRARTTDARGRADELQQLRDDPEVLWAEPNKRFRAALTADPRYDDLYAIHNAGQTGGTADADIDAPEAWQTARGAGAAVGVVDSGIDLDNPELELTGNRLEQGGGRETNGIDDDLNGFVDDHLGWDFLGQDNAPEDGYGHGTHVGGIVAATEDEIGVVGIAPQAELVSIRVMNNNGFGSSETIAAGLAYAGSLGLGVVNVSLGVDFSHAVRQAIADHPNTLYVAAAGNDATVKPNQYPCNYPLDNIVCVGASDHDDLRWPRSNLGEDYVDLFAPGHAIWSTWPGGTHEQHSGTSMAAPYTAGVAALLLGAVPGITTAQLRAALLTSVDTPPGLGGTLSATDGRLNAAAALAVAGAVPAPRLPSGCTPQNGTMTCTFLTATPFTVPQGIDALAVDARGGRGGSPVGGGTGGVADRLDGTLPVSPGSTLHVRPGGDGGADGTPGQNGGGTGGPAQGAAGTGGGGGGASDVRDGPGPDGPLRLVAAGGGGGAGRLTGTTGTPGAGGAAGAAGTAGMTEGGGTAAGGGAGTTAAGGARGGNGTSGTAGRGGAGGAPGGGGGGSGRHGGGGGAGSPLSWSGGGGGGASLVPPGFTKLATTGTPRVTFAFPTPSVAVTSPASGTDLHLDAVASVAFACTGATAGPEGCTARADGHAIADGAPAPTGRLGRHEVVGLAFGANGLRGTSAVEYFVGRTSTAAVADTPTTTYGESASFTATVTSRAAGGPAPDGHVEFLDGDVVLGQGAVGPDGVARYSFTHLGAGRHTISARYGGSLAFLPSSGTVAGGQMVTRASTSAWGGTDKSSAVRGEEVAIVAQVYPAPPAVLPPTGRVTIRDGGTTLAELTLDETGSARLATSDLPVGTHAFSVAYAGDANHEASSFEVPTTLTVSPASTTTALTTDDADVPTGSPVTFAATVATAFPGSGTPAGTVTFADGATTLGTAALDGAGRATLTTSALAYGQHTITASYGGEPDRTASTATTSQRITDGVAPVTTDDVPADFRGAPVTVTLSAVDVGGSGVSATHFTVGAAPAAPTTASPRYDPAGPPVLQHGQRIRYLSVDGAGNAEVARTSHAAKVDTTPPASTATPVPSWSTTPVEVTVSAADTGAGVQSLSTTVGDRPAVTGPGPSRTVTLQHGERVRFRAVDAVGNTEVPRETAVARVDPSPPSTTDDLPAAAAGPVRVTLSATDTGGSGVAATRYTVGADPAAPSAASPSYDAADRPTVAIGQRIRYASVDVAGNVEALRSSAVLAAVPPDDPGPPPAAPPPAPTPDPVGATDAPPAADLPPLGPPAPAPEPLRLTTPRLRVGAAASYAITFLNSRAGRLRDVVLTHDVPNGLAVRRVVAAPGARCTTTRQALRCRAASLATGRTLKITVHVRPRRRGTTTGRTRVSARGVAPATATTRWVVARR